MEGLRLRASDAAEGNVVEVKGKEENVVEGIYGGIDDGDAGDVGDLGMGCDPCGWLRGVRGWARESLGHVEIRHFSPAGAQGPAADDRSHLRSCPDHIQVQFHLNLIRAIRASLISNSLHHSASLCLTHDP